jgi:anti-sigma-K factor RskA
MEHAQAACNWWEIVAVSCAVAAMAVAFAVNWFFNRWRHY